MTREAMEETETCIALAVIWRPDLPGEIRQEILVEYCKEKDLYLLPSGKVRPGDNSSEAIHREIKEKYSFYNPDDKQSEGLTLRHSFRLAYYGSFMEFEMPPPDHCKYIFHKFMLKEGLWYGSREHVEFPHNSCRDIKLIWCHVDDLHDKLAYPDNLVRILVEKLNAEDEGYIYAPGFD